MFTHSLHTSWGPNKSRDVKTGMLNVSSHGAERTLASWKAIFWVVWEALARTFHSIGNGPVIDVMGERKKTKL